MPYDPNIQVHRQVLAVELLSRLNEAGFVARPRDERTREMVFSRPIPSRPGISAVVFTSIVEEGGIPEVREAGRDAIRCMALYSKPGADAPLRCVAKADHQVFRTGEISDIGERTIQRLRDVWKAAVEAPRCKACGAPTFLSKKGNQVCAEVCWAKK